MKKHAHLYHFLLHVIVKIGRLRTALFAALFFLGALVHYLQPYLIPRLFSVDGGSITLNKGMTSAAVVSLMILPLLGLLHNGFFQSVRKASKETLWEFIGRRSYQYFNAYPAGKMQRSIDEITFAVRSFEHICMHTMMRLFAMLLLYTGFLLSYHILLGLVYAASFIGYMSISVFILKKNTAHIAAALQHTASLHEYTIDFYQNKEVILSAHTQRYEDMIRSTLLENERAAYYRAQAVTDKATVLQQGIAVLLAGIVIALSVFFLGKSSREFLSVILMLLYSIIAISGFGSQYLALEELSDRMQAGLEAIGYRTDEALVSSSFPLQAAHYHFETAGTALQMSNLDFGFTGSKNIFIKAHFSFPKGCMTAVTGANGSGKSTLLRLICGLYTPVSGSITVPYAETAKILYIPQNAPLFNRSILQNITYPDMQIPIADVLALVAEIRLDSLIHSAEDLTDKTPGDFKSSLSGGEQQKILLLRALITKPHILLFDELTAHLDQESGECAYRMMRRYLPESTIIGITHKTQELHFYDHIVAID